LVPGDPRRFDGGYYDRFYGEDGAHDSGRIAHLAAGVHGMAAWWGVTIRSVLDVGAGMGMWRDWYRTTHPRVRVRSTDVSAHACATWGHELRDITTWRPRQRFDLVICHSVLQYVHDDVIAKAVSNLVAATGAVLYLEVPTVRDMREVIDPSRTDLVVHQRTGDRYRELLSVHLRQAGAGLWVRPEVVPLYELEGL
jgi:SAM-dependent methyltransferase